MVFYLFLVVQRCPNYGPGVKCGPQSRFLWPVSVCWPKWSFYCMELKENNRYAARYISIFYCSRDIMTFSENLLESVAHLCIIYFFTIWTSLKNFGHPCCCLFKCGHLILWWLAWFLDPVCLSVCIVLPVPEKHITIEVQYSLNCSSQRRMYVCSSMCILY